MELVKPRNGADLRRQKLFFLSTCPDQLTAAIEKYPSCPTEVNVKNTGIYGERVHVMFQVTQWVSSCLHSLTWWCDSSWFISGLDNPTVPVYQDCLFHANCWISKYPVYVCLGNCQYQCQCDSAIAELIMSILRLVSDQHKNQNEPR